jgi:DNA-binding LytR/AlgR family response regulator
MERIIIIDDNNCKKELADFLEANKEHIRFNSLVTRFKSSPKGFFDELVTEYHEHDKLAINSNQHIDIIHTSDITYIESLGTRSGLHFINEVVIETLSSIDVFEEKLKGRNFIRVHDRYIVNFDYFSKLNVGKNPTVVLVNGNTLPVNTVLTDWILSYLEKMET